MTKIKIRNNISRHPLQRKAFGAVLFVTLTLLVAQFVTGGALLSPTPAIAHTYYAPPHYQKAGSLHLTPATPTNLEERERLLSFPEHAKYAKHYHWNGINSAWEESRTTSPGEYRYRFSVWQRIEPGHRTLNASVTYDATTNAAGVLYKTDDGLLPTNPPVYDIYVNYAHWGVAAGDACEAKNYVYPSPLWKKPVSFSLDEAGYTDGQEICVQAILIDAANLVPEHALIKKHTLTMGDLPGALRVVKPPNQGDNLEALDHRSKTTYSAFPLPASNEWNFTTARHGYTGHRTDNLPIWREYYGTGTDADSKFGGGDRPDTEFKPRKSYPETMEQQTASIILSATGTTGCEVGFNPYNPPVSLDNNRGVCAPVATLDLLISKDFLKNNNGVVEMFTRDLCRNGWDDYSGTLEDAATRIFIERYQKHSDGTYRPYEIRPLRKNIHLKEAYDSADTADTGNAVDDNDCYEDWQYYNRQTYAGEHDDTTSTNTRNTSAGSTYLAGSKIEGDFINPNGNPKVAKDAHHLYEFFEIDFNELWGNDGWENAQEVILNDPGDNEGNGISYLDSNKKTYLKYRLMFDVLSLPIETTWQTPGVDWNKDPGKNPPPERFMNLFSIGFADENESHFLSYSTANGGPVDPNGWEPKTLAMSNNGYGTNLGEHVKYRQNSARKWVIDDSASPYRRYQRYWDSQMDIALPCDVFSNQGILNALEEFYEGTSTLRDGSGSKYGLLLPPVSNALGSERIKFRDHLMDPGEGWVALPIGLFDSDLNGGDNIPSPPTWTGRPHHKLTVTERDRSGSGGWGYAERYSHIDASGKSVWTPTPSDPYANDNTQDPSRSGNNRYNFDGKPNTLNNLNNLNSTASRASNATEAFYFKFKKDKVYRVTFRDIHYRNWVQFILPFGQEEARKDCARDIDFKAEITETCNLIATKLNWQHPISTVPVPNKVRIAITYGTQTLVELDAKNEESNNQILIPFGSSDPGQKSWEKLSEKPPGDPESLQTGTEYLVKLIGYYDANGNRQTIATDPTMGHAILAEGHGLFEFKRGSKLGEYQFQVGNSPVEYRPSGSSSYCAWAEFEVEIDEECAIYITKLNWSRPNVPDPELKITIKDLNGQDVHSFENIAQLGTPPLDRKLLIRYGKDELNPNEVHTSKLIAAGDITPGVHYILQITGYHDNNGNVVPVGWGGNIDKNYTSGLIAGGNGSPGPPAIHFYIHNDNTNPDNSITKIKYGDHKWDNDISNWGQIGTDKLQPPGPNESCEETTDPIVKFVKDPTDADVCDLRLVSNEWSNTVGDEQKDLEITITGPSWTKRIRTNADPLSITLMEWVNSSPSVETFKSLLDGVPSSNGTVSVNDEFLVELTGYYDQNSNYIPYSDAGFSLLRQKIVVEDEARFTIRQQPAPAGYYFDIGHLRAPSGLNKVCNPNPEPEPEIEIEVTSDCKVVITSLNWNGYKDDHDNNINTLDQVLGSANNFIVEIGSVDSNDIFRKIDSTKDLMSGTPPLTYLEEFTSSNTSLKSLLDNGRLQTGQKYEIRLTGFSVGSQEKPFRGGVSYIADRIAIDDGYFSINPDDGFRIYLSNRDYVGPCLGGATQPVVNISIDQLSCDIIIDSIGWNSNDGQTHDLELTFSPNSGIRRSQSTTASTLYAFDSTNPPYGGQLNTGTYNIFLTGYFDAADNGTLKDFSDRDPNLADNESALGVSSFEIVYTPNLQSYHIMVGSIRIPTNPTQYCFEDPCSQPTPPPQCASPECSIPDQFKWTNHPNDPHRANDRYGVRNSIWYETNPNTTINIANERYNNTFSSSGASIYSTIRTAAGNTGPFPNRQTTNTFYVMPTANRPGQPIPVTTPITRQGIIDDLIDGGTSGGGGFEYNFSDDYSNVDKRDSVWALFGGNYKPETSIKWNSGLPSYSGSGNRTGWGNNYTLRIQPSKLAYENSTPPIAVVNGISPSNLTQIGRYPSDFDFVEFETLRPQTHGNNQSDDLLTYKWDFYWRIDVEHTHELIYDKYVQYISRKDYEYRWVDNYWEVVGQTTNDNGTPLDPTDDFQEDVYGWGPTLYAGWYNGNRTSSGPSDATDPTTSSYTPSNPSPGDLKYVKNIRNIQPVEWDYFHSSHTETETRKTTLTGELTNCSYVLIVKPPECRVQRRRPFANDTRSNPTPQDNDSNHEIFPPGKPDYFSQLQVLNGNPFPLTPTSADTKATLQPTLNTSNPWYPRNNAGARVGALPSVGLSNPVYHLYPSINAKVYKSAIVATTEYKESNITPRWPGEYRLNWDVGWESGASQRYPDRVSHYDDPYRGVNYHKWQGQEPPPQSLTCNDPADGIYVYVSAKPPVCRVNYSIFELNNTNTGIEIGLQNNNWVDLVVHGKLSSDRTPYKSGTLNIPPGWPTASSWPSSINARNYNTSPYGPSNYSLPQGYEAERPTGVVPPPDIPNPIAGDADALPQDIPKANYPWSGNQWLNIISDNRMAQMPAPIGEYTFKWDLRTRLGIEWWSTTDTGKLPLDSSNNPAWWAGDNNDERIIQNNPNPRLGNTRECKDILRVVRIPFVKTFLGGMSAGGRFGLGDEYDSCKHEKWIENPTTAQGIWAHSDGTNSLSTAVGSSVEQALRAQKDIGGVYSSSLTNQLAANEPKALTYANTSGIFGGNFSPDPDNIRSWRCLPNYWQIPDNANLRDPSTNPPTIITGLAWANPADPEEGAKTIDKNTANKNTLPGGPTNPVDIKDGDVLYIDGDLEITGDIRQLGEKDLRASIFVKGNVIISGDIPNNDAPGKYFGFSDMGLIQIVALGDIHIQPQVTRIDATLVAYPDTANSKGGAIDLCASETNDDPLGLIQHYQLCSSDQLIINGGLVAQRVYLNRIYETLNNGEPFWANYENTKASEVIVLMPEYHFVTPAASVFDDWVKRPQAIFDIPTSL